VPSCPSFPAALLAATLLGAACGQAGTDAPTLVAIQLDPADASVASGRSLRLGVKAAWSDGSQRALSGSFTWSTSDAGVVTVDGTGMARGVTPGTVTVSAFHVASGRTGTATLTVTAPVLEALVVSPATRTLPAGLSSAFMADGRLSDGSASPLGSGLAWSSSDPDVASVDTSGLVLGLRPGDTTIRATHAASGLSATATLTVSSAVVQRLEVAPATPTLAPGLALQLSATARLTDGTTAPLGTDGTWSSSSASVATVDAAGLLQAVSPGQADVTVTHGASGVSTTVRVTVTTAALTRLDLSPAAPNVSLGLGVTLAVTGHGSDGSSGPVLADLAWSVADPAVAVVDAAGQATGLAEGSTTITASHGPSGLTGTVTLTVGPAALVSLAMSPAEATLAVGQWPDPALFAIVGTYSDGRQRGLGPSWVVEPIGAPVFAWTSSAAQVAQVSAAGRVTPLAPGVATITALDPASGLSVASQITVVPDVQVGVYVNPDAAILQLGGWSWTSLVAHGRYLSGQSSIYFGPFPGAWVSSAPSVATVNDQGSVTAVAPGTATITFTDPWKGFAGTAVITVQ